MSSAVAPPIPPPIGSSAYRPVDSEGYIDLRLEETRRHVRAVDLTVALLRLCIGVLFYLLAVAVVDHWLVAEGLGRGSRLALWVVLVLMGGWYGVRVLFPPLLHRVNPIYAAQTIEQTRPSLKNGLINFLLLRREPEVVQRDELSKRVYQGLQARTAAELGHVTIGTTVDRLHVIRLGYLLATLVAICCVYFVVSPKNPLVSFGRVIFPWARIGAPTRVTIDALEPGDVTAYQGDNLLVSAEVHGLRPGEPVSLYYSSVDGQSVDQYVPMIVPENGFRYQGELPPGSLGLQQSLLYWIAAGDGSTRKSQIDVQIPPAIVVERVEYDYPEYTGLPQCVKVREGDIRAIEGTQVTIHGVATYPIAQAFIELLDGDSRPTVRMTANGSNASGRLTLAMSASDPAKPEYGSYQLRFTDSERRENPRPIRHRIEVIPDQKPDVRLVDPPPEELQLPVTGAVELKVHAEDPDFGLRRVELRAECQGRGLMIPPLLSKPRPGKPHQGPFEAAYRFQPAPLRLKPGDKVTYWAEAADCREKANDPAATANVSETDKRTILIVAGDPQKASAKQPPQKGGPRKDQAGKPQGNPPDQPDQAPREPGDAPQQPENPAGKPPATKDAQPKGQPPQSKPSPSPEQGDSDKPSSDREEQGKPDTQDASPNQAAKPDGKKDESGGKGEQSSPPVDGPTNPGEAMQRILEDLEKEQAKGSDSKGSDSKGSDSKGSDSKGSDSKGSDSKGSDSKGSDSKGSDSKGSDSKGSDSKGSDSKGSDSKGSDSKGSDSKGSDSKGSDSKGSDSKGSDSKGSDSKGSDSKGSDSKGSDAKGSDSKGSDSKGSDSKGSDSKGSDAKGSDAKGSDAKGSDTKGSDTKGSDTKGSDAKGSDAKGSDTKGSDTKGSDTKGSDAKGSDSMGSDAKGSDAKGSDAKGSDAKGSDAKGSDAKGSDAKGSDAKGSDAKGSDAKGSDAKGSDAKGSDAKGSDAKGSDAKGSDAKGSDAKGSDAKGSDAKGSDAKGSDAKGSDAKGSDAKGSDAKGSDAKGSDAKGSDAKGSDAKGSDAKGSDAKGSDAKGSDAKGSDAKGSDAKGSPAADKSPAGQSAESKAGTEKKAQEGGDQKKGAMGGEPQEANPSQGKTPDEPAANKQGNEAPPASPSASPKTSDTKSDSDGDRSADGKSGGQQAKQSGKGNPGSQTSSEEGGQTPDQKGKGETGTKAGQEAKSDKSTGKPGTKGEGGEKQPGGEQAGKQPQPGDPSQKNTDAAKGGQPNSQSSSGPNPGQKGGSTSDNPAGGQSGETSQGTPPAPPPPPAPDDPNLDYARKQTTLALEHLADQLAKEKPELLEQLGWNKTYAQDFIRQWEAMKKAASQPGPQGESAKRELDKALKSLGLRPAKSRVQKGQTAPDKIQQLQDTGRFDPPPEWMDQYRAFNQGVGGGKK